MKITPFLESASQAFDYKTAAAAAGAAEHAIHARTGNDDFDPNVVVRREVHTPEGKLTFFSRARMAGEQYRDKAGRPIWRVDGFCVADDPEGKFVFHPHYLEQAEKINTPYFERFWPKTSMPNGPEPVTEEIAFRPDLPEQAEGMIIREPYRVQEKSASSPMSEPEGHRATRQSAAANVQDRGKGSGAAAETARDRNHSKFGTKIRSTIRRVLRNEEGNLHWGKVFAVTAVTGAAIGGAVWLIAKKDKEKETKTSWAETVSRKETGSASMFASR